MIFQLTLFNESVGLHVTVIKTKCYANNVILSPFEKQPYITSLSILQITNIATFFIPEPKKY